MSRPAGLFAVIVAMVLNVATLLAEEKTVPVGDTVCLTCREVDRIDNKQFPQPLLARELIRQAFLIAARDECGLLTRDATLREEFPLVADAHRAPFDSYSYAATAKKGVDYCYALGRGGGKTTEKLWNWKYHVDLPVTIITIKSRRRGPDRAELGPDQVTGRRDREGVCRRSGRAGGPHEQVQGAQAVRRRGTLR